jgi:hypothetical protein
VTAHELVAELDRTIRSAPPEELAALLGAIEQAKAAAWARLITPPAAQATVETNPERVLTYAQAAEVIGCRASYVETLVRQNKLPVVILPGTNKGGEAREGKFRRILLSSLLAHLKASETKALDAQFSAALNSSRDRQRAARDPNTPKTQPNRIRRADRRALRDGLALGDGATPDPAHGGEAGEAAGRRPRVGT